MEKLKRAIQPEAIKASCRITARTSERCMSSKKENAPVAVILKRRTD